MFHCANKFCNKLSPMTANDSAAQNAIITFCGKYFYKTFCFVFFPVRIPDNMIICRLLPLYNIILPLLYIIYIAFQSIQDRLKVMVVLGATILRHRRKCMWLTIEVMSYCMSHTRARRELSFSHAHFFLCCCWRNEWIVRKAMQTTCQQPSRVTILCLFNPVRTMTCMS